MSAASPAPAGVRKNRQAKATVAILNTVRTIGTTAFGIVAALCLLGTLIGTITSDQHFLYFIVGILTTGLTVVFGALYYAVVGWYVDSLKLLTQIAHNTTI
jgi:hypothetical protein